MNVSYIIHKIPKDGFFSLAISIKNADGILSADKRSMLLPQDKKIAEALIKDFNTHKSLKVSALEYGKFDKIPVSDKQTSFFFTELAKVRDVSFETKKIVIDALSFCKLFYNVTLAQDYAEIKGCLIDGLQTIALEEVTGFWGQDCVWVLHKSVLKRLKQDFRWLKIAQMNTPLEGKKREDLIDHYENELPVSSDVPEAKFHYIKLQTISPVPCIQLKNERGLFFDLKFNYPGKGVYSYNEACANIINKEDESFWEKALLETGVKKSGREYFVSSPQQNKIFKQLKDDGWDIISVSNKPVVIIEKIASFLEENQGELQFTIELSYENEKASLEDVMTSVLRKTPLVNMGQGLVGLMPFSLLEDLEVVFRGKKQGQKITVDSQWKGDFLQSSFNVTDRTVVGLDKVKFDYFNLKLLDFQKEGVAWLLSNLSKSHNCLLADDMGLGKTIQVLALIDLMKTSLSKGVLVVCPKSIKAQWKESIERILKGIDLKIDVMSFHELRAKKESLNYSLTVIDEAQAIKNAQTLIFQKCSEIVSDLKIALSGTPVENSLKDVVTIFEFLFPALIEEFKGVNLTMLQNKLTRRLAPFIKRRMKNEVIKDLPQLFEQDCIIEMGESQSVKYYGLINDAKTNPVHAFTLLTNLRLAALDERLIDPSVQEVSSKTWQVIEDISQIVQSDQKVIVFSQFTSYLALIKTHLQNLDIPFAYLDGSTVKRDEAIAEFFETKNVLIMSLKAGGVGLNLQVADYVLILDPWWNDAAEKQAIDRAYRLGRDKPVVAKRYLTSGTLETKIKELKESKWALLEDLKASQTIEQELLDLISGN